MDGKKENIYNLILFIELCLIGLVYKLTMLPYVGFWDTGEFQTIAYSLDIAHPTGYPSYILLGHIFLKIFPFGSVAWRMNLFSLFCTLGTLLFLYKTVVLITKNRIVASLGILTIAIYSKLFWQLALQADPHALHLFFSTIITYLLIKAIKYINIQYLYLAVFFTGLSLGNHMLTIFFIPAITYSIIIVISKLIKFRLKQIFELIFLFFLGLSSYGLIIILGKIKPPLTIDYQVNNLHNFIRLVGGMDFSRLLNYWTKGSLIKSLIYYSDLVLQNFPYWLIPFLLFGLILLWLKNKNFLVILCSTFFLTVIFSLRYQNGFLERYFLYSFTVILILACVGIAGFLKLFTRFKYRWIGNILIITLVFYSLIFKFSSNFETNDQSNNWQAYQYATEVFTTVPQDAYYFTWWNYATPIWYMQKVEGINPNMKVINMNKFYWDREIISLLDKGKKVYLNETLDNYSQDRYQLMKIGNIYKAEPNFNAMF